MGGRNIGKLIVNFFNFNISLFCHHYFVHICFVSHVCFAHVYQHVKAPAMRNICPNCCYVHILIDNLLVTLFTFVWSMMAW